MRRGEGGGEWALRPLVWDRPPPQVTPQVLRDRGGALDDALGHPPIHQALASPPPPLPPFPQHLPPPRAPTRSSGIDAGRSMMPS